MHRRRHAAVLLPGAGPWLLVWPAWSAAGSRGEALAVVLYSSSISLSAAYPGGRECPGGSGGVNAVSCPAAAW